MKTKIRMLIAFAVLLLAFGSGSVQAELIAYDQFADYTDGVLAGQGQGFGWAGNWGGSAEFKVSSEGDLSYGGLDTYGGGANSGTNTADGWTGISRTLATAITNSGTYYLGFLIKQTDPEARANVVRLQNSTTEFWAAGGSWDGSSNWVLARRNGPGDFGYGTHDTGVSETTNVVHMVIKLVFNEVADSKNATLYVNPADTNALAGAGAFYDFSDKPSWSEVSAINVTMQKQNPLVGNIAFDEIRVGTTPEDMFEPIYRPPSGTVLIVR